MCANGREDRRVIATLGSSTIGFEPRHSFEIGLARHLTKRSVKMHLVAHFAFCDTRRHISLSRAKCRAGEGSQVG